MFYPSCLRSPENITCPSLILIRAQNWPKPWWSPRACSAEHILSPNLGGLRIWAFSAAHGLHSLNRPQTHLCTKVHSETSFTLTSLDTSRFWVPFTLYQWCPNLFASQLWYRTAVWAEPVSLQCRKKGVVFWCNDCVDAISHYITQLRTELCRRQRVSYSASTCSPPRFPVVPPPSAHPHTVLTFHSQWL